MMFNFNVVGAYTDLKAAFAPLDAAIFQEQIGGKAVSPESVEQTRSAYQAWRKKYVLFRWCAKWWLNTDAAYTRYKIVDFD